MRRATLLLMLIFLALAASGTHTRGEQFSGEPIWLAILGGLLLIMAFSRQPSVWALMVVVVFAAMQFAAPDPYIGAAWFAVYAACADVNSRRPLWMATTASAILLLTVALLIRAPANQILPLVLYLVLLTLLGQFIRLVFSGSRAASRAAELDAELKQARLHEAVHDSAGARLAQALLVARNLHQRPDLTTGARQ